MTHRRRPVGPSLFGDLDAPLPDDEDVYRDPAGVAAEGPTACAQGGASTTSAPSSLPLHRREQADASVARAQGEVAMQAVAEKAEDTSPGFREAARAAMRRALDGGRELTGEQLVDHCRAAGIVAHDDRAFGPVIAALARAGEITSVGWAPRAKGHGTGGARVWRAVS